MTVTGPGYDVEHAADLGAPERDVPFLDAVVCRHPDTDELLTALGNRDPARSLEVELRIRAGTWSESSTVETLASDDVSARSTPAEPERFRIERHVTEPVDGALRLSVPPSSVVWVRTPSDRSSA